MKAIELEQICPYPGLRSFTEEESLYFKGRDQQVDQITALLEQNKFLMVTGASGEGKSSLIYAGLIPNARAGFFKARYSNWLVATFRPERTPLTNMAASLAAEFHQSPTTIETELRRGFSSLIDLYTNSSYYAGDEDEQWNLLSEQVKKERKRKAANLIILVDQFEEFFTSPENFVNDVPSKDSQTVINLILETSRIAIRRNLPVYVVCTMRSDYIGQCTAFRGLPEYIGFSQFFVPRLKRKDLKQVIEEPAGLSGNRITQRLIERLVFDVAEGVDQLPILQHALRQVWLAASHGKEEMDLVHYAIAGGMPANDLPDEDLPRFKKWFSLLPVQHQNFYRETGLSKVIGIHANLLYEDAWQYYNSSHPDRPITQKEAKRIIALAFSCLTKIDDGRAIRNRMTLAEITGIINTPGVTEDKVGEVLNIFREEGNSFLHPFKTGEPETFLLAPGTVLDITHESLIRNWNKLEQWANQEFEYYSTYLDFKKQLDRWVNSGRKSSYLLPLGPLTYFENWYKNCKPNTGWITRYSADPEHAKEEAFTILNNARAFLGKSGRREMLARAFVKYGPRRIATVLAILVMLGLSSFYLYNAHEKRNDSVIERVRTESFNLLKSTEVSLGNKANYLLTEERFKNGTLLPYLEKLEYKARLDLAIEVYKQLIFYSRRISIPKKQEVFDLIQKDLLHKEGGSDIYFLLTKTNQFQIFLAMDNYFSPDPGKAETLAKVAEMNYERILHFYQNKNLFRPAIPSELNLAIHYWLITAKVRPGQIQNLLQAISPLSGPDAEQAFQRYYAKGSFEPNGRMPTDFNGGFHTLASLYAALGQVEQVIWCYEKMLENNGRDYFESPRILNNHLAVIGYLYQFGHRGKARELLQWIATHTIDNPPATVLRNSVLRAGYISHLYPMNISKEFYRSTIGNYYPSLCFVDREVFDQLMEDYDAEIRSMKDQRERDFNLALNAKRKAMFYSKYWYDRNLRVDQQRIDGWLQSFVDLYLSLDPAYLEGTESSTVMYNVDGVRTNNVSRKNMLLYPDYRDGWFAWTYHTDCLFNFLQRNGLLGKLYKTGDDLQLLHFWIANANQVKPFPAPDTYYKDYKLPDSVLEQIISFVDQHPQRNEVDKNLFHLLLANRAFEKGDTARGLAHAGQVDLQTINSSSDKYEYLEAEFFRNMMKDLCCNLAAAGKKGEAIKLAGLFAVDYERSIAFTKMAEKVYRQNANPEAFEFLDSAYAKAQTVNYAIMFPEADPRYSLIMVLSEIGSSALNSEAISLLRDIPDQGKFAAILSRVAGVAFEGNFYRAYTSIPGSLTESQDLECRMYILLEECRKKERLQAITQWKPMDEYLNWNWNHIIYIPQ